MRLEELSEAPPVPPEAPPEAGPPPRRRVMRQYELVERVRGYDPGADEDLLNRAYVFAMKAHGSQLRASGDPYFHHPVEVAGILAALKLDSASIATGLLHDTVEDTGVTLAEIGQIFGPVVAKLVDGVTKLSKIHLQNAQTAQAENFRKLLLAMSEDIRVLLVKLADRLHNMRTLHFIANPDKRRRIAAETMEIYAPLAERIGMEKLKVELEDLAFAELWPDARASILHRLEQLRENDHDRIDRIVARLSANLREAGVEAEVAGREKSPLSIWRKMQRKNISFEQLSDIMAFRVTVGSVSDCYAALGIFHALYAMLPGRFKDFISTPKPNGYRSLHTTVIGLEGRKVEIQIRTKRMHEESEFGVAAHWAYKQESRNTEGRQYRWVRELLDILEQTQSPEDFLEHTKLEMFQDQVFCFTPKGDVFPLPRGATPVDFAYAVHSEVGDHCVGARVDGRMVNLRTPLQNGDQVEIITSRSATPTPAWERFVVTGKARARIRRYLRLKQRESHIAKGRDAVRHLARERGVKLTDKALAGAAPPLGYKTLDDLLAAVGDGRTPARAVLHEVAPAPAPAPGEEAPEALTLSLRRTAPPPDERETESPIDGLPVGVAFQLAGCCRPVPGEPILGVVRTGRPVGIHRTECPSMLRLADGDHRLIQIGWNARVRPPVATSRLAVTVANRPGSLGSITTLIGKQQANIADVRVGRRTAEAFEMILEVEVGGVDQLQAILAALRASTLVENVERVLS
ncbi:MAG: bifunctional (p)ppGpp synthetase/guanosine-3',5'-bis(diphosphate) 3'-pyrophosphohydrolase [Geminicoccaceae bacterium]|nr:bifunctional (p)ppGpp synthetase/guanosine-3',5'-bis(diphosphate) 3'-pyrophosphohydrolase [Geminicoccaceae bacterium]